MNSVVVSGYLQKKAQYVKNDEGVMEFRFFLNVYSIRNKSVSLIPIKCKGEMADECYSKIKVGHYVEVVGEIVRPSAQQIYVIAHDISFKAPKGVNTIHIRQTEFLEIFDVSNVLERLPSKEKKKREKAD